MSAAHSKRSFHAGVRGNVTITLASWRLMDSAALLVPGGMLWPAVVRFSQVNVSLASAAVKLNAASDLD